MTERSRMPASDMCSVRGIGVADSDNTSTDARNCLSFSFCMTPKRCSSSRITSPRSLNRTSFWSRRWVPITTSISPTCNRRRMSAASASERKRDSISTLTGNGWKRSPKVRKCCCARTVVGTRIATCLPSMTALNAARTASSVLLQPGRRVAAPHIFLHPIEVLDGDVELVPFRVLQLHVLALLPVLAHQPHPDKATDAVIDVHHEVAGLEFELPGRRASPHHTTANALAEPAKQVGITVDLELLRRHPEALRDRLVAQHNEARSQRRLRPDKDAPSRVHVAVLEQLAQPPFLLGHDQHPRLRARVASDPIGEGVDPAGIGIHRLEAKVNRSQLAAASRHIEVAPGLDGSTQSCDRDQPAPQPLGQLAAIDLDRHELSQLLLALLGLRQRPLPVDRQDRGVGRQVVQESGLRGIEVRLKAFDA